MNFLKQLSTALTGATIIASVTSISALSAKAATFTYSDSTFKNDEWELTTYNYVLGGTVSATQIGSGGIGGEFRRIVNTVNQTVGSQNSTIVGFHIWNGETYSPKTQGAITSVDYSENSIMFYGSGQGQGAGLALKQNGNLYWGSYFITPERSWTRKTLTNLVESDFRLISDRSKHPDFSENGADIQWGFARGNTSLNTSRNSGYTIVGGIDNWSVTITTEDPQQESVPEPSSIFGLFLLGGFGVRSLLLRITQ